MSVAGPRARDVRGFLKAGGDGYQRAGLLGQQAGQRPVERDERRRGVMQRPGGVLERQGALREQPLDRALRASAARARAARCW